MDKKPKEKSKSKKCPSIESNISKETPFLFFGKRFLIIVALAYSYGFIVIWSAYGSLGLIPYWYPIFLFLPPGICYMVIAVAFLLLGTTLGGEDVKLGSKEEWERNVIVSISFVFFVTAFRWILLLDDELIQLSSNPKLFALVAALFICGTLLYVIHSNLFIHDCKKASIINGLISALFLIAMNIVIYDITLLSLTALCGAITWLGMLYLTPNIQDIEKKITVSDKLKNPTWVALTAIALILGATWYGSRLYFSVNPALGGGRQKPTLFIGRFEPEILEYISTTISDSCFEKHKIVGDLLGETNAAYFIRIKTNDGKYSVISVQREMIQSMIFKYAKQLYVPEDSSSKQDVIGDSLD